MISQPVKQPLMGSSAGAAMVTSAAIFLSGLFLLGGCEKPSQSTGSAPKSAPPVPVTLVKSRLEPMERTIDIVGTLYGDEEADISAKVPGRIVEIHKDVGDRVNPGQELAQIEQADYELLAKQKELALGEALAKLGLKDLPGSDFDPAQVPLVKRARLAAENAQAKVDRSKELHDQDPPLLSDQDYADLQTAAAIARSNHEVELLNAQAALAEAKARKAELDFARQRLADATIRAPLPAKVEVASVTPAGTANDASYAVAARHISAGEYVKEGTVLFRLVDDDPVKLRGTAPERYSAEIQVGQKVRVAVEAYKGPFEGRVARVNPQVDQASRAIQFEILIPNPSRKLKPGGFARASVQVRTDEKAVMAPTRSVVSFAGVTKIFIVRDGKAVEKLVEPGRRKDDWIEIVTGLKGDETIVADGAEKLAGGMAVEVK